MLWQIYNELRTVIWQSSESLQFEIMEKIYDQLKQCFAEGLSKVPTDQGLTEPDMDRIINAIIPLLQHHNNAMAIILTDKERENFGIDAYGKGAEKQKYYQFYRNKNFSSMWFFVEIRKILNRLQSEGKVEGFWGTVLFWREDKKGEG